MVISFFSHRERWHQGSSVRHRQFSSLLLELVAGPFAHLLLSLSFTPQNAVILIAAWSSGNSGPYFAASLVSEPFSPEGSEKNEALDSTR